LNFFTYRSILVFLLLERLFPIYQLINNGHSLTASDLIPSQRNRLRPVHHFVWSSEIHRC